MGNQSNAMTEIALALAMGFFSIMVVAMVSLGAGGQGDGEVPARDPMTVRLVQSSPSEPQEAEASRAGSDIRLVIYHQGRFLDAQMNPVDPESLQPEADRRVVLALPPDLAMREALDARNRLAAADPVVAALTDDWMQALEERQP